jgi:hypothetical protein
MLPAAEDIVTGQVSMTSSAVLRTAGRLALRWSGMPVRW